ncbi:uncharacterized protein LOC121902118 [Thunnus maccoyii]|uniref:uncharacterized protein LOC121902118 n=1 Tax=Thunnus maccoyii TaxID=8240 RepID=UPI001C4BBBB5|nr:uncharacterized protein LOC121902118 [Thunnus maccoyii]XP_042275253.1 uncharacterized protein LOC121902118 [Thunnus maccoyii]XP_042275254.1 uncharacterized protein LOC121902118 [Thunnus maccoyii]XP_042275255.1 uncharacterized protein LOC121902118 [Thunnus maccoyii]XP_042275256.1 uncharacterized protein LOC121902118 [Thunnus maccoyii]XP_042275257.1 uncharacterized protein LOC121902118 [Thunnus maccoyii]XP_042275258.1 uncharacterized protein LOC121902118 [Thunnus maccoyii]XP_042275259.1 unc
MPGRRQSLYESTSSESQTYVQWLRKQKVKVGSRMHTLQAYMLGRDMAAQQTALQPSSSAAASADPSEPSDDVLLAAAMEVDSQLVRDAPPAVSPPGPSLPPAVPPAGDGPGQLANLASSSGAELLPRSWRLTLPEEQQDWLGRARFTRGAGGQPVLTSELRLWWFPPGDRPLYTQPPTSAHAFFQSRFFLWAPYRMWAYRLVCPTCGRRLTDAGLYKTVRRVLDRAAGISWARSTWSAVHVTGSMRRGRRTSWSSWTWHTRSVFQLFSRTSCPAIRR